MPTADILFEQRRLLVALESTYGTDAVAAALADGAIDLLYQKVRDPVLENERVPVELGFARSSMTGAPHKTLANASSLAAKILMTGRAGSGAGNEAPPHAPFLRSCGFKEVIVEGVSATYTLSSIEQPSLSAYLFYQTTAGKQRLSRGVGLRGNPTFNFATNEICSYDVDYQGRYVDEVSPVAQYINATSGEIALLADGSSAVTDRTTGEEKYVDADVLMCRGMTTTVGSNVWKVNAMDLVIGWALNAILAASGASGVDRVKHVRPSLGSRIGGSFTLHTDDEDVVDDFLAKWKSAEEMSLSNVLTAGDGSSGSARLTVTASNLQLGRSAMQNVGGHMGYAIPYFLNGDASDLSNDSELTLKFDAVP